MVEREPAGKNEHSQTAQTGDSPASEALASSLKTMSKYVLVVAVVVGCAIAAVGALSGGQVLKGSLLAAAIGIALAVVTFAGVHIVVRNTQMLTAIMAGDYLVKVAVMVVTILVVGKFSSIDPKAAGYGLLVTILAQVMTQTWILMRAKIQTIELTKKDNQ